MKSHTHTLTYGFAYTSNCGWTTRNHIVDNMRNTWYPRTAGLSGFEDGERKLVEKKIIESIYDGWMFRIFLMIIMTNGKHSDIDINIDIAIPIWPFDDVFGILILFRCLFKIAFSFLFFFFQWLRLFKKWTNDECKREKISLKFNGIRVCIHI